MPSIAIIPARGGSKRIPHKNIKLFLGKPIISYSIKAAKDSGVFDKIMVSTDDESIANIAEQYGADVPWFRSPETSDDHAVTADVLCEVLGRYRQEGKQFDSICCIYATAPFVTAEKIRLGMNLLNSNQVDTVHPVIPYSFPPQRGYWIRNDRVKWINPEYELSRSQDLETMYHDAGQFYCINASSFSRSHKLIGKETIPIICREIEAHDIDNEDDWRIAEIKYMFLNESSGLKSGSLI
jgi:N-acylneuraminate cytidylyltransferase